jgi:hypothetical protein
VECGGGDGRPRRGVHRVTYDGERLRAYACDGSARRPATISAWFEAAWDGREPVTIVSGDRAGRSRRAQRRPLGLLADGTTQIVTVCKSA